MFSIWSFDGKYSKIPIIRRLRLFYNWSVFEIVHYVYCIFTSDYKAKTRSVRLIGTVLKIGRWEYLGIT